MFLLTKWIAKIAATVLGVRLSNAILDALDWDPMPWLVARIMDVPTERWVEVSRWAVAFLVAIMIWGGLYFWRRKPWEMGLRITARQAVRYLVNDSRWGWRTWLELRGDEMGIAYHSAIDRINKAAQQNVVHFRGRRWDGEEHEDIDADQWRRIGIASQSVLSPTDMHRAPNPGETEAKNVHSPTPISFKDLTVPADEVLTAWPRGGLLYRLLIGSALLIIRIWWCLLWPFEVAIARWREWRAENI